MATKPPGANAFESLRQSVASPVTEPSPGDWMTEQLRRGTPRTTAPLTERVGATLRDADRYLKTGATKPPTPEGSTFVKGGLRQAPVAAPTSPTTLAGKVKANMAPGSLLRNAGRGAGALGVVGATVDSGIKTAYKAADGDYEGAALEGGKGLSRAAGAWAGGVAGAKLGAAAGLGVSAVAPIAAPIALPALTALGGIGGAFAGSEGMEKAYDWATEKVGLRTAQPSAPQARPFAVTEGLNTQGMPASGVPGKGRTSMDSGRNFTNELSTLPETLPTELRQGVIVETRDANGRPVFSGRNVAAGAPKVDGLGQTLRQGGTMTTFQGANPFTGGSQSPVAPVERGVQGGGMASLGPTSEERDLSNRMRTAEFNMSSSDRRKQELGLRQMDMLQREKQAGGAQDVALRSAQTQADTSRYVADQNLRGEEARASAASLRGRQSQVLAQQERQAQSLAMQQANGDYETAAQIMDQMGYDGSKLRAAAGSTQDRTMKNRQDGESFLTSLSIGEDNKVDAGKLARNAALADEITGGKWSLARPDERIKLQGDVRRGIQLLDGLNQYRDAGWLKAVGIDASSPAMSGLPQVQGATVTRVGAGSALLRQGITTGAYKIQTQQGEELFVPAEALDEASLDMLKRMGAKLNFKE